MRGPPSQTNYLPKTLSQNININFGDYARSQYMNLAWGGHRFYHSLVGKESACSADQGSIPGFGRSPGEGNGKPLQYSCLENPMDRGPWQAIVHEVISIGHDLATFKFSPLGMQVNGHSSWCHFTNNYTLISCRACSQCPRHCAVSSGWALVHLIPTINHWGKFFYYPHFPGWHREVWKCQRSHSYDILGKWPRVGRPTNLSLGGLHSGGASHSYVQPQCLLFSWPWARDWLIFSRLSLLINKVGILIIVIPVLFSYFEDWVKWCT